jgi:hypothetical protein
MRMTTRSALTSAGIVGLGLLAFGCSKITGSSGSSGGTTPGAQASAATTTTAAPAVNPASAPTGAQAAATGAAARTAAAPGPKSAIDARAAAYPLGGIHPMADGCATPTVVLANAPASVGDSYGWQISRQAFLANQQFKIVSGQPDDPGEVHLSSYHYNPFGTAVYALVAECSDGTTCNQVAAMYKSVVRSSSPQVVCGAASGIKGISGDAISVSWGVDPKDNMPPAGDRDAACARLSACWTTYRPDTPGDPFLDCQGGKAKFDLACASRYPCSDVLACAGAPPAPAGGAAGGGGGPTAGADDATGNCPAGYTHGPCIGLCNKVCTSDSACGRPGYTCADGICMHTDSPCTP